MGLENLDIRIVDSVEEAMEFKRWASLSRPYIAVDTETTGFNTWAGDKIRLIQFGDTVSGWAVPWEMWGGVALEVLRAYSGRILMHNAKFDMTFINHGQAKPLIHWGQVDDTRTLAFLADPTRPTGLKPLSDRYIDRRASAMQSTLDDAMVANKWTWSTVPIDFQPYWVYGVLDTILTAQIWEHLQTSDEGLKRAYDLELSVLPVLQAMEIRGAYVDTEYASARKVEFLQRVTEWKLWAEQTHGIMVTSNQQFIRRMTELGVTLTKKTKSGALSADKEVVAELMVHPDERVRQLALCKKEVAQLIKLSSGYLDKIIDNSVDGIIHASINPLGARTSRMSITGAMALQTLPRASKKNPPAIEVRNCFVAKPGNKLAMCDFDQVELRLTGHYSFDESILEILRDESLDPFTEFAKRIYDEETMEKSDERRALTKSATYATLYGAGVAKFSQTAGIDVASGQDFMDSFYGTFPGIKIFQRQLEQVAQQRLEMEGDAYVRTPFGHKIVAEPDKIYKLVNYCIQGTAANVMKRALVDMDNAGLTEYLVMPVHDEVVIDAPESEIHEVMHAVQSCMEDTTTFQAPLRAGLDGPFDRWGQKYESKDD